jgi:hypothetical protein
MPYSKTNSYFSSKSFVIKAKRHRFTMTLSIMTVSITTLRIITLSITTLRIMAISITINKI